MRESFSIFAMTLEGDSEISGHCRIRLPDFSGNLKSVNHPFWRDSNLTGNVHLHNEQQFGKENHSDPSIDRSQTNVQ
jgi:hypothetical protein